MKCIWTVVLTVACLLVSAEAVSAAPSKGPKPSGSNKIITATVTDAVVLKTPHLELGVSRRTGAFYIKDKSTGEFFGSGSDRSTPASVTIDKKAVRLHRSIADVPGVSRHVVSRRSLSESSPVHRPEPRRPAA